jgi:hypothetical protein
MVATDDLPPTAPIFGAVLDSRDGGLPFGIPSPDDDALKEFAPAFVDCDIGMLRAETNA